MSADAIEAVAKFLRVWRVSEPVRNETYDVLVLAPRACMRQLRRRIERGVTRIPGVTDGITRCDREHLTFNVPSHGCVATCGVSFLPSDVELDSLRGVGGNYVLVYRIGQASDWLLRHLVPLLTCRYVTLVYTGTATQEQRALLAREVYAPPV